MKQSKKMDCLLKVPTRGNNILDWCLVNKPKLFDEPVQLPNIGSSDHFSILINPSAPNYIIRERRVYKRETKDSNVRAFGRWICNDPWSGVFNEDDCQDKFNIFYELIMDAINAYFPLKKQKVSVYDKPWVSNKLKQFISKRQTSLVRYGKYSHSFKFWRNKVQAGIRSCKESYYKNKVHNMKDYDVSKWWKEIKKLGYGSSKTEWCEQLMGEATGTIEELAENINSFFVNLSSDFQPLEDDPNYQAECPPDMLVDPYKAYRALKEVKCHKSVGPGEIPTVIKG